MIFLKPSFFSLIIIPYFSVSLVNFPPAAIFSFLAAFVMPSIIDEEYRQSPLAAIKNSSFTLFFARSKASAVPFISF